MPQEKKSRWRGDAPPSLGYLGLSSSGCLGSQFFISLAPWRKLCWFFCLLIAALSLCQESTNVWSPGCLGNLPMPSYRFFFFKSGFSSYSQQEFWSASICSIIARSKIYILHNHWRRQESHHETTRHYYRENEQWGRSREYSFEKVKKSI